VEKIGVYKVKGRYYELLELAEAAELESKILEHFNGYTLTKVIEKLAKDAEYSEKLIEILEKKVI